MNCIDRCCFSSTIQNKTIKMVSMVLVLHILSVLKNLELNPPSPLLLDPCFESDRKSRPQWTQILSDVFVNMLTLTGPEVC